MKTINRSALVIRPKEPYLAWAAGQDTDPPGGAAEMRDLASVYLVPPDPDEREESAPLSDYFGKIFEMELEAWSLDRATWPSERTLQLFLEWFYVDAQSIVVDLASSKLRVEEL